MGIPCAGGFEIVSSPRAKPLTGVLEKSVWPLPPHTRPRSPEEIEEEQQFMERNRLLFTEIGIRTVGDVSGGGSA